MLMDADFLLQVVWHGYVQAMRQAGFTGDLVLYVASGLLTYGANEGDSICNASQSCPRVDIFRPDGPIEDLHRSLLHAVKAVSRSCPAKEILLRSFQDYSAAIVEWSVCIRCRQT